MSQLWLGDGDGQMQRRGAQSWHVSFFLVEGQLLCNVEVVSAIHQHESVIIIYRYLLPLETPSPLHSTPLVHHPFYFIIIWNFPEMIKSLALFVYIVIQLMALLFSSLPKTTSHL